MGEWEDDGAEVAVLHLEIYVLTATYLSVIFSELLLLACNHASEVSDAHVFGAAHPLSMIALLLPVSHCAFCLLAARAS